MLTAIIHNRLVYSHRMERLAEILAELIREDCREILDVGCGDGKIDAFLMKRREGLSVRGIDVLVREKVFIPVGAYDGKHIPLEDGSVDTVLLVDVLHHTEDPDAVLREAVRVAVKNVIIKDHVRSGKLSCLKLRLMDYVGNAHYHVSLPYHYLSGEEWERLFREIGLEVQEGRRELHLYAGLLHLLFDGKLHFVVRLGVRKRE